MWEININDQLLTFFYALGLGLLLCVYYDVLRAFHKAGFNSAWGVFIGDIIYCITSAFITFLFLLARTNGEIRGYVLTSALIGFVITRLTLSRVTVFLLTKLIVSVTRIQRFLSCNIMLFLFNFGRCIVRFCKFFQKNMSSALKYVKKLLKSAIQLLYTKKNSDELE